MTDRDGELHIIDTRECAIAQRVTLDRLDRAVCLAADRAPRADRIAEAVAREHRVTASDDEVAGSVRKLVAAGLILPVDGRLVGLAVPGAIPDLLDETQFPGGYIDMCKRPAEDMRARRLVAVAPA
jgi:hypothetical protein